MQRVLLTAAVGAVVFAAPVTAQVCRVVPPAYQPAPERPESQDPWDAPYPDPEPNAEVKRLLAEAKAASDRGDDRGAAKKLEEAKRAMDRWSKQELRRLHRSGMAAAQKGGPRAPKEVPDILHIAREASTLGVETDGIALATDVLRVYHDVRLKELRTSGMATAQLAQEYPPDELREALHLGRQYSTLSPEAGSSEAMQLARELYGAWATARFPKLEDDATAAIESGLKEVPRQASDALKIVKELNTLGEADPRVVARGESVLRTVLEKWLDQRAQTLRSSGETEAAQAGDLPPAAVAELAGLREEMQKFSVDAGSVRAALVAVLGKWVGTHTEKLAPPGHAAARSGSERHPEQLGQLVAFGEKIDCFGEAYPDIVKPVRGEARAIGEANLEAFRDKLDCPAKPDQLTTLRELGDQLEAYGWGPYNKQGPACGWRGTIISRTEKTTARDTIGHPSGQPIQYKMEGSEWVEIRWDVDGDVAHVTITGQGNLLVHNKGLVPMCGFQETRETSNMSVISSPSTVPVKVTLVSGNDYVIEAEAPAYTHRTESHTKREDSQACPLKGGESSETQDFDVRASPTLMRAVANVLGTTAAGKPKLALRGEMTIPLTLNYSKQTTRITWDLVLER